jgi:Stage II sporulation protein E (SpoIIE)/GAF domain
MRASAPGPPDGPSEADLWLGASLDLGDIAELLLDMSVPKFADGGVVFVLERLVTGEPDDGAGGQLVARRLRNRFVHEDGYDVESDLPAGEVFAFAADSPYAEPLSTGKPLVFGRPDSATLERIRPGARAMLARYTSFLSVPMSARGRPAGLIILVRRLDAAPFSAADIGAVVGLAERAGASIANASEFSRHRLNSQELQRGLVPAAPALPALVEVAWRSTPAPGQMVGGDWYDVVTLPDERAGLIVGDVMGHGPAAALVMAQLRAAAHTLADLDLAPGEMMRRLDRTAGTLTDSIYASCVYAVVDPGEGSCTMALAGHLPPVLALPDGRTHVPRMPAGMPVGLGTGAFGEARIKLPPGAILALYTDGLVDSRTRSYERGMLALRSALAGEHGALSAICDSLINSLRHREDDVTVVLARIPARPGR